MNKFMWRNTKQKYKGRIGEMAKAHTKLGSSKYTFSLGLRSLPNDNVAKRIIEEDMGLDVESRTQNANEELLESNNNNEIELEAHNSVLSVWT